VTSPTIIPGSECHVIGSKTTGRDYEVSVWRPAGIDGPLPLLVVTDGNLMFPVATSTVALMVVGSEMPAVQVVGVGYPADLAAVLELREADLVPARDTRSSGADGFFVFLRDELQPWLEQHCDVTPDRALFGASLGGLFALHVLVNHPGHFNRYVIVSPAVVADPGFFDDAERVDAPGHAGNAAVALMAGACEDQLSLAMEPAMRETFASLDTVNQTDRVEKVLSSSAYSGLQLTTTIIADQTHFTMPSVGMAMGLRHVFG
jgi:hypothetical protein